MVYAALLVAAASFIYPFIWMIGAAFALHEIGKMTIWPDHPSWGNFRSMIEKIPIGRSLINSILVAALTTTLVLITGSTVGYALAKMRFKGRQLIILCDHFYHVASLSDHPDTELYHHGEPAL
jgi:multiple sugar transport system permease protein